jgi:aminopeptidase N
MKVFFFKKNFLHQVCHHWLGNLVSTEIWIKEGLAQYFEKIIVDDMLKRKPFEFSTKKKEVKKMKKIPTST